MVCSRVRVFNVIPARTQRTAGVQSGPKSSGDECRTWKSCWPGPRWSWSPNRKAGRQEQPWDGRRSQRRHVMCRTSPRRSGLERREESVEPIQLGIAIDERRLSPGAPKAVAQRSTVTTATNLVLPSCPTGLVCVLVTQPILSNRGSARKGLALDRFEPCEGKLSRTVLRGAWAG